MQIGEFVFDFPVFLIAIQTENAGTVIPVMDDLEIGITCVPVFTDQDLLQQYCEKNFPSAQIIEKQIDCKTDMVASMKEILQKNVANHISFDPVGNTFIAPINDFLSILEQDDE